MANGKDRRGAHRTWGPWTVIKLDALSSYLPAFMTTTVNKTRRTMYLDLLAGSTSNTHRDTGEEIIGSAERALRVTPPFARVVLCERDARKVKAVRAHVAANHPRRDVVVLQGDCNVEIPAYLRVLTRRDPQWRWAPTFALVDQYSADVHWSTLQALAGFRLGERKIELWMYFGESFFPRGLGGGGEDYVHRMDAFFGNQEWRELHQGRKDGVLGPDDFRKELVNLMRWQLQEQLGYKTTIPLQMVRDTGQGLYTMIFATDHDIGEKIMLSVLRGSEDDLHQMVARARHRRGLAKQDARAGGEGFDLLDDWAAEQVPDAGRPTGQLLMLDPPHPPWSRYETEDPSERSH